MELCIEGSEFTGTKEGIRRKDHLISIETTFVNKYCGGVRWPTCFWPSRAAGHSCPGSTHQNILGHVSSIHSFPRLR